MASGGTPLGHTKCYNKPFCDDVMYRRKLDYYSVDHTWEGGGQCQHSCMQIYPWVATREKPAQFVEQREHFQLPSVASLCDLAKIQPAGSLLMQCHSLSEAHRHSTATNTTMVHCSEPPSPAMTDRSPLCNGSLTRIGTDCAFQKAGCILWGNGDAMAVESALFTPQTGLAFHTWLFLGGCIIAGMLVVVGFFPYNVITFEHVLPPGTICRVAGTHCMI